MDQIDTDVLEPSGRIMVNHPGGPDNWLLVLWRRRRFLALMTALGGMLAAAYAFLAPSIYTAQLTLLPRPGEIPANALFSQLANITGFSAEQSGSLEAIFDKIIVSDAVLEPIVAKPWDDEIVGGSGSLWRLLKLSDEDGDSAAVTRAKEKTKVYLRREAVSFSRDDATGFMRLRVSLPRRPVLAASITNELIAHLDTFLRRSSQTRASDQRRFIETRLHDVQADLRGAEERLVTFETTNRGWAAAPELGRMHGELSRDVQTHTTVWIELTRQLELARLDEVKDTIRVEVLDAATVPVEKSGPFRGLIVVAGLMLGFLLAGSWVLIRQDEAHASVA